ncbi:TIGR02530 family flagellar biosynthesis protein [Tuberibacillus calidus]|uniref:TIGR02530 family flagellar biosynthesis protein n=1 Tax=Tuberibacillus calidus TaxID=340097 RepID=UPI00041DF983|nr:TIGR02530 family flagellar biosynthesis protein [Tuberibacillus calidus]
MAVGPIHPYVSYPRIKAPPAQPSKPTTQSFHQVFNEAVTQRETTLKISKHAAQRMAERQITFTPKEWEEICQKVREAKSMGIKESLVVTKKEALVVSPQNETVITVLHRHEASKQIFSNIDGAILLDS